MSQSPLPVREIMSAELVTVTPDDDLGTALKQMSDFAVHRLPVVREQDGDLVLVGMITDRDLRLAAESPFFGEEITDVVADLRRHTVADVMSADVVAVSPEAPLAVAAEMMLEHHFGGLPVAEQEHGKLYLVGIVTRTDMLARLVELETREL